jgi:two-component sensor histidine kinase
VRHHYPRCKPRQKRGCGSRCFLRIAALSSGFTTTSVNVSPCWLSSSKCACGDTSDELQLTVKDSGAGFDREAAKESRGLGLISMEERLKLVKGTFSINSQPKRGTTIHARVPLSSGGDSMRAAG